MEYLIPF